SDEDFRWRAFFQRSTDPLFVLNRQGYLLFVNAAWEKLTGVGAAQARRMYCHRPQPARPSQSWKAILAHALTPPPEVLGGTPGRAPRLDPAPERPPPVVRGRGLPPAAARTGLPRRARPHPPARRLCRPARRAPARERRRAAPAAGRPAQRRLPFGPPAGGAPA